MAKLPTVRVRRKDGHEVTINVSRYEADPAAYEVIDDDAPAAPQPAEPEHDLSLLDGTVGDVEIALESIEDPEHLAALDEAESAGDDRKGVHEAIAERLDDLEG